MNAVQQSVNLELIILSTTNTVFRGKKKEFTPETLKELTASISEDGVIQPILLRPSSEQPGKFHLIAGERRFHASKFAGKTTIPAYIREADDEKAFRLQMVENIQREGVHPINEAHGFKMIIDADPAITTADLSLRFGKSETYIIQRLKLNDLVHQAKQDFLHNKMLLGHAIILSRLTPQNQREAIQQCREDNGYATVQELENFVSRNITNLLSDAPFDKENATLLPKAGACSLCPKRSGASPLLFSDIKESDRCMDKSCFQMKCQKFLVQRTREIIESEPTIVFLKNYSDPMPEVQAILDEHKVKPLKEYDDFNSYDKSGKKVKGFWISGKQEGHTTTIHIKSNCKNESVLNDSENVKSVIDKIHERTRRARELDQEKVHAKIINALKSHPTQKMEPNHKLIAEEEALLWYIVLDKAGFNVKREINRILGLNNKTPEKVFHTLKALKPQQKAILLRKVMLDQYAGIYPTTEYGYIVHKIAEGYRDIDIKSFQNEQSEIRTKREARAKDKIKAIVHQHKSTSKTKKEE